MGELTQPTRRERLENWKEIAQYLRRSVRTVQRWEDEAGLPVHRLNHDQRSSVYAYTDELELWRINREPLLKVPEEEVTGPARSPGTKKVLITLAVATLLGAAALFWYARKDGAVAFQTKPLSSLPGNEQTPALSPDGVSLVFTYGYQGAAFLYRMRVEGGDPIRLTQAVEKRPEFDAAWSPDGKWIGFLRHVDSGVATLIVIPAAGGPERELGRVHGISMGSNMRVPNRGLGWMADSRALIVSSGEVPGAPNRLWRVDLTSGARAPLTTPPPGTLGDAGPSISPDGWRIAFHRALAAGVAEIFYRRDSFRRFIDRSTGAIDPARDSHRGPAVDLKPGVDLLWLPQRHDAPFTPSRGRWLERRNHRGYGGDSPHLFGRRRALSLRVGG